MGVMRRVSVFVQNLPVPDACWLVALYFRVAEQVRS
jgi:hypothetical protein